jgi:hypothetical protein
MIYKIYHNSPDVVTKKKIYSGLFSALSATPEK